MVNAATNTKKTYAQAAIQIRVGWKGKGLKRPAVTPGVSGGLEVSAHLPQRFPFVEDLGEYEVDGGQEMKNGMMAKAVVIYGIPTNWKINGLADCAGRIMGEVIGVRWLLSEGRRIGKAASSEVVYLQNEVFLGLEACIKMSGKRHSVVAYRWRA